MGRKRKQYGREREAKPIKNQTKKSIKNITKKISEKKSPDKSVPDFTLHTRDVNSRRIFKSEELTCQFLKDYADIPVFKDIRPEDIEDVTAKYQVYLGVEFETDTIKKVRVRAGEEQREVYVIPLIEHKSSVDYNVQMQILRYMSVIWYDYGRQKNKEARRTVTSLKSFRYPPILPIVYFEGTENWTAEDRLWKRIELGEEMRAYIPDFAYKVIRVQDYSNEEIRKHTNEMSLVMMLNKIQSPEDYTSFIKTSETYMADVLKDTPQELLKILQDVFWALLMKMNVPQKEAAELMKHMGAKDMGYLFENAKKMDIQAERRNTQKEKQRADQAEAKAISAESRAKSAEERASSAEKRADTEEAKRLFAEERATSAESRAVSAEERAADVESFARSMLSNLIEICKKKMLSKEETKETLRKTYKIKDAELEKYFEELWK